MLLKELKKGDYFKKNNTTNIVLVRSDYDPGTKKYLCYYFEDVNHFVLIKSDKVVFTEFEF